MGIFPHFLFDFIAYFYYICPIKTYKHMKIKNAMWAIIKIFVGRLFLSIITLVLAFFLLKFLVDSYEKIENDYVKNLGTEIIINNDTLIIVDFSIVENSFVLNNGTTVSKEYIKKYKVK